MVEPRRYGTGRGAPTLSPAAHAANYMARFLSPGDTLETVRDTSLLAEACIAEALESRQAALEQRFGVPRGRVSGRRQQLIVLAMGKLGARELNVSSDIDLIFAYPEAGETDSETKPSAMRNFYPVGRAVISALDQVTAEGFVFRWICPAAPWRERRAGTHLAALEEYYQDQGRDWERLCPDQGAAGYRRAGACGGVDGSVAALRVSPLRGLRCDREPARHEADDQRRGARRGLQDNVKLGHGGIREVEFIAQRFQLIRGGATHWPAAAGTAARVARVRRAGMPARAGGGGITQCLPVPARQ